MLTNLERATILNSVIAKLNGKRAIESKTQKPDKLTNGATVENPTGFDGVDELKSGKFRARIRFCNALDSSDCRITLGTFHSAELAGYAYCEAHIQLWGSASRYVNDPVF